MTEPTLFQDMAVAWSTEVLQEMTEVYKSAQKHTAGELSAGELWRWMQEQLETLVHSKFETVCTNLEDTPDAIRDFYLAVSSFCKLMQHETSMHGVLQQLVDVECAQRIRACRRKLGM